MLLRVIIGGMETPVIVFDFVRGTVTVPKLPIKQVPPTPPKAPSPLVVTTSRGDD